MNLYSIVLVVVGASLLHMGRPDHEPSPKGGLPLLEGSPRLGAPGATGGPRTLSAIAVVDLAHSSQISPSMMSRTPIEAAQWFVQNHLVNATDMGVTLVIIKHPYRWRPEPFEDYRFGGVFPARRAALHAAIHQYKALLPKLCAYQALPSGDSLSVSDQSLLIEQADAFDEDAWEAIGCKPWQQAMIDQRRLTRTQHLEPVWDIGHPAQFTYPIDVTELFMSAPLTQYQLFPEPRPEIRCWYYRAVDPFWWEDARESYIRMVRKFDAWCIPKGYVPVHPLDIYTELDVTADMLNIAACAADYDGNGFVNGDDFDDFAYDFTWGVRYADFNGDGFVTGDDLDLYMLNFMDGC